MLLEQLDRHVLRPELATAGERQMCAAERGGLEGQEERVMNVGVVPDPASCCHRGRLRPLPAARQAEAPG